MSTIKSIILLLFIVAFIKTEASDDPYAYRMKARAQNALDDELYRSAAMYYNRAARRYENIGHVGNAIEAYDISATLYEHIATTEQESERHHVAGRYYGKAAEAYAKLGDRAKVWEMCLNAISEYETAGEYENAQQERNRMMSLISAY